MMAENKNQKIRITMEDGGTIDIRLDPEAAPITVENFVKLADKGFYDGLTFHRIIPGFMIQGGDPLGTGTGGSGDNIKGEFAQNGVDNPIRHERGVISMARSQFPDSASSQFFITNADATFLDGQYAAFGTVTAGMETVDKISGVKTGAQDKPLEDVVIRSVRVIE
jgi:peptidyl-prolyl cis-trans isomerase B (cyclophilin B)